MPAGGAKHDRPRNLICRWFHHRIVFERQFSPDPDRPNVYCSRCGKKFVDSGITWYMTSPGFPWADEEGDK